MNLKQSRLGRFYIKTVTKSSFFFPIFVVTGLAVILLMTVKIKVDVIKTYQLTVSKDSAGYLLLTEEGIGTEITDKIYIYESKNKAVYKIENIDVHITPDGRHRLSFDENLISGNQSLAEFLGEHLNKSIKADIPIGKISLLERIFSRGGIEN